MTEEKKVAMYKKILKNGNKWENHPTENTILRWVNPDDIVDIIHKCIDNRIWDNIERYINAGIFVKSPVIRVNLDYSNYIQVEQVDYKNEVYIIRLFIGKGANDIYYVTITNKHSVLHILRSIKDNTFFYEWRKRIAATDFGYARFDSHQQEQSMLKAAFI